MNKLPKYLTQWKFCPQCSNQLVIEAEEDAQHLHCLSCDFRHFANPFPTSSVTLLSPDKQHVLLGKREREPKKGTWALPGGFIDWRENSLEAARRELMEETGMIGNDYIVLGEWEGNYNPAMEMRTVNMHYLAIAEDGQTPIAGSDCEEVKWFHYSEVAELLHFTNQRMAWEKACEVMGFDLANKVGV